MRDTGKLRLLRKACYSNAAQLALDHPDKYTYVEGYVLAGIIPVHHAWVVDRHGRVIDLTLRDRKLTEAELNHELNNVGRVSSLDRKNILGRIPDDWEYFGVPIKTEYVRKRALETKRYGSLIDDWEHGFPLLKLPQNTVKDEVLA
jgi:hypothetical protein